MPTLLKYDEERGKLHRLEQEVLKLKEQVVSLADEGANLQRQKSRLEQELSDSRKRATTVEEDDMEEFQVIPRYYLDQWYITSLILFIVMLWFVNFGGHISPYSLINSKVCPHLKFPPLFHPEILSTSFLPCVLSPYFKLWNLVFLLGFTACVLDTCAIKQSGKNVVCNIQYGPLTQSVRGIYFLLPWCVAAMCKSFYLYRSSGCVLIARKLQDVVYLQANL